MKTTGKLFLAMSIIALIAAIVVRSLLGYWAPMIWLPMGLFVFFVLVGVAADWRWYLALLKTKSTKNSLNMGTLVLLFFVFLFVVNFLVFRHNIYWDMTEEKLNTLSPQTVKVLERLDSDLELIGFFKNTADENAQKNKFNDFARLYQAQSYRVKVSFVDPVRRPDIKSQHGVEVSGVVVVSYKDRRNTIAEFSEQSLTNAIVRVTRERRKTLYFLNGHGEVDIFSDEARGGSSLKQALEDVKYRVEPLNLLKSGTVPEEADVLAIVGPARKLLKKELTAIKKYLGKGGRVFLCLDPQKEHGLGEFLKGRGIGFDNIFLLGDKRIHNAAALVPGLVYSQEHPITKVFSNSENSATLFFKASSLSREDSLDQGTELEPLVRTGLVYQREKLEGGWRPFNPNNEKAKSEIVGMTTKAKISGATKKYVIVAFGDSDFLTNQYVFQLFNRDLVLNVFAHLAKVDDLISIRPKRMKVSKQIMTRTQKWLLTFGLYIPLPVSLVMLSFLIWRRRRNA
jgi:ABC-type uncharacterized transport system involved in gliding motility auxiliary subunit